MIFAYFWILGAVRGKSKETLVRIKVVYGTNKHIRSASCEKWSRCRYFVAVIPFLTDTFLEIAVSRILEAVRGKSKEAVVGIKVDTNKHIYKKR